MAPLKQDRAANLLVDAPQGVRGHAKPQHCAKGIAPQALGLHVRLPRSSRPAAYTANGTVNTQHTSRTLRGGTKTPDPGGRVGARGGPRHGRHPARDATSRREEAGAYLCSEKET
jgi:hypothetical protein